MFADLAALEEALSRPTPEVVQTLKRMQGDLLILGVGGKIGPSLARMARRATEEAGVERRIYGVARFSSAALPEELAAEGIEPIRADLLDRDALARLPEAENVLYLAAMKFGSTGQEARTWAMNCYLPGMVCERYRHSRMVAYSTGNVYPLMPANGRGSQETDAVAPIGDYAMSCLGRERVFHYFSEAWQIPVALLRLNYANELRYGTLVDIAQQVWAEQPIDLRMGYLNAIWQGDSNAMTLRAFDHVAMPPRVINLAGPDRLSVRQVAAEFGRLLGKAVRYQGQESADALLSDGSLGYQLLGATTVCPAEFMQWIADWVRRGGPTLGKPTHFQTRDGKF